MSMAVAEFIHPNFHVMLVHFPIALIIVGVLIELFSFMWRRSGFRAAGRWMILIGTLVGIPTLTSGLYAGRDVLNAKEADLEWRELTHQENQLNANQRKLLIDHVWLNSSATVLFVIVCVVWLGASDNGRRIIHIPMLVLLIVGVGLMGAGAWHAGEMVYREGTAVEVTKTPTEVANISEDSTKAKFTPPWVEKYCQPMQMHLILAGVVVALSMAALGLSIRAITAAPEVPKVGPKEELVGIIDPLPTSRFWLLTALTALLTAGGGYYIMATTFETWKPMELWNLGIQTVIRRKGHIIFGVSIVFITLILAGVTRWAPRNKLVLSIFSFLLILAIAGQVWIGFLLLYDTHAGPLTGLNKRETPATAKVETSSAQ